MCQTMFADASPTDIHPNAPVRTCKDTWFVRYPNISTVRGYNWNIWPDYFSEILDRQIIASNTKRYRMCTSFIYRREKTEFYSRWKQVNGSRKVLLFSNCREIEMDRWFASDIRDLFERTIHWLLLSAFVENG